MASFPGIQRGCLSLLLALSMTAHAAATPEREREIAIRTVLTDQAAAWNRGDLDAFMQGYWKNDALRFASGDNVTTGWQATLDGYRKRYANKAAMGTLRFEQLDIEPLSDDAALVFGRWSLQRDEDRPHGLFTLLLRKMSDGWKITRDHTSSAAP